MKTPINRLKNVTNRLYPVTAYFMMCGVFSLTQFRSQPIMVLRFSFPSSDARGACNRSLGFALVFFPGFLVIFILLSSQEKFQTTNTSISIKDNLKKTSTLEWIIQFISSIIGDKETSYIDACPVYNELKIIIIDITEYNEKLTILLLNYFILHLPNFCTWSKYITRIIHR